MTKEHHFMDGPVILRKSSGDSGVKATELKENDEVYK